LIQIGGGCGSESMSAENAAENAAPSGKFFFNFFFSKYGLKIIRFFRTRIQIL
jgi:hypothetical protein